MKSKDDDLISRQAALDALGEESLVWHEDDAGEVAEHNQWRRDVAAIKALPTVPGKSGWWLIRSFGSDAKCSECGMYFSDVYDMESIDNYCRHCGTKMNGLKYEDEADV